MGWLVNAMHRSLYPRERDPVPVVQEAGWTPGPVWTCAENLAPTGIRSPDRQARSESLYRLSYPVPHYKAWGTQKCHWKGEGGPEALYNLGSILKTVVKNHVVNITLFAIAFIYI
jgi:hypothetical protein